MGEGRGTANSSSVIAMILLVLCMFVFHPKMIHAETYTVGDDKGWSFGVQNWPSGKTFKEGDILVFNYTPVIHSVVTVKEFGYNSCFPFGGSGFHISGADKITLVKGMNYFICGTPGHCSQGQKIAVNAI
ncbi:unnamed protein product [Lathyrus oleraceus]|uniref:Basic blue protein n=1 Tax=Pisum sativum TaxID=3888 RepID=A0A9D5GYK1_PEA|nr:basic blue protein-like [Pisum sativum]KAI5445652.1 hypothetical protein KIW84_013755 [Pisum sativum]